MQSIYVHFPFCEVKCHYCDFYSLGVERTRPEDPQRFVHALRQEVEQNLFCLSSPLETIFLGGGTPSMTACDSMKYALEPLLKAGYVTLQTEWTMEANPSSVSLETLCAYRALGVNRVSMGVQAMNPELLRLLGRVHSRDAALKALDAVFLAGFKNVSVDLLCGVPRQTEQDLHEALEILTRFPLTHLSCYLLTLPPHHKLYSALPKEDVQLSHLLLVDRWLTEHGFEHYEISNFSKPGQQAQHNLRYWKGFSYLGLGPSAHSFDASKQKRWKNVSSLHKYVTCLQEGSPVLEWSEELTEKQQNLEKWMLHLRLEDGFPGSWLQTPSQKARAKTLMMEGLLEYHPKDIQRIRLTAHGFALSDSIIQALAA